MAKTEIQEIDFNDIVESMVSNVKDDIKSFDDYINLYGVLKRQIFIGEIEDGIGDLGDNADEKKDE